MTEQGFRFCPRCGTALVAGMPFCPKCGFNSADIGASRELSGTADAPRPEGLGADRDADPFEPWGPAPTDTPASRSTATDRRSRGVPIMVGAVVVAAGLIVFGLLTRPPAGGEPSAPQGGSPVLGGSIVPGASQAGPTAPIVGITIETPQDGQAVATGEVTVIGIAPPGLTITRDVSFGLDQHTTVDGTGHWAMGVRLEQGENTLVFRIGDDRSTERKLRVTFVPPAQ